MSVQHYDDPIEKTRRAAFDRLWDAERERVWRLLLRLVGSVDVADDLAQEVCVRAYQSFEGFRGAARPSTWLHRIAVNVASRWRERRWELSEVGEAHPDARPGPESAAVLKDGRDRAARAIDRLPDELRVPLVLHAWEDCRYKEIAELLEIPLGTVMSRLHAARKRLREELKDEL